MNIQLNPEDEFFADEWPMFLNFEPRTFPAGWDLSEMLSPGRLNGKSALKNPGELDQPALQAKAGSSETG